MVVPELVLPHCCWKEIMSLVSIITSFSLVVWRETEKSICNCFLVWPDFHFYGSSGEQARHWDIQISQCGCCGWSNQGQSCLLSLSVFVDIIIPERDRITITPSVYAPYFSTQYILWTQERLENIDDNLKGYVLFYTSFLDR